MASKPLPEGAMDPSKMDAMMKYTAAQSKFFDTYEKRLNSVAKTFSSKLASAEKAQKSLNAEIEETRKQLEDLEKEGSGSASAAYKKSQRHLERLIESQREANAEVNLYSIRLEDTRKIQSRVFASSTAITKHKKAIAQLFPKKQLKSMKEYKNNVDKIRKAHRDGLKEMQKSGAISGKQRWGMRKDYEEEIKALKEKATGDVKLGLTTVDKGAETEERKDAQLKIAEGVGGGAEDAVGGFFDMLGLGSETASNASKAFHKTWKSGKKMSAGFNSMKSKLDAASGGSNIFVGALKALGMAFKSNPIGLILGAAQALISIVNDLDKMIKVLNKSWMEMYGSPALVKDVRGEMKKFNDSLFDVSRNMRLGIKSKDAQEFFKNLSSAGLSLGGVQKKVGDYNATIETGFRLSRQFGVSFSEMGTMMGDQMMNLRSSLEDVSKSFKAMSYDASVAGVQSQKFYQVIESASSGLSFYGNYLKETSAMLRKFTETGQMGFRDATNTVQTLMGTIKNMSTESRLQLISVVGEEKIGDMFKGYLKQIDEDIKTKEIEVDKLNKGPEDEASKARLKVAKTELQRMKGDRALVRERLKVDAGGNIKGDITGMASVFDVLSDKISEVAFDYMRNTNVDPFEDILASEKVLQQVFNWDKDMANKVMKQAAVIMDGLRGNVDNFTDSMKAVAGRFEMTELKKNMDDFYAGNRDVYKSQEDMIADAEKKFKEMGIGGKELDTALLVFSQGGSLFFDMLEDIKQGTFDLKKAEDYALKVSAKQAPVIETEMADKQLDELIKQTTPLADYLEIGKEGATYALAGSDLQRNISLGVTATARYAGDIFKWMTRHERKATKFELSTYEKNVAMREHLSKASEMYAAAGDTAGVESVKDELDTAIKYIETFESTFKGSSSEMKAIVNKVSRDDKLLSGNLYAENIRKIIEIDKELAEKSGQQLSDEEKLALKTKKAGLLFASKHRLSQIRPDYSLYDQPPPKLAHAEPADAEPADVKPVTGLLEFFKVFKDKSEPADVKPVKVSKDKSVTKGGVLLAETGDLVVSNRNQAKGVDGNRGQMFNSAQSIIRTKGGGGGSSFSIGNISLSFNAPLNGKPEDYKKVFVQAVTDIVNKRLYEDKMKVKTA